MSNETIQVVTIAGSDSGGGAGDSDEIDCDLDNGYYICIKCNDGVYVICPACGESDFIDKINFQNGTYEYECNNCDHIRTIEIESFK